MNTVIGIGGTIALVLLTVITLVITIPELVLSFPAGIGSVQAVAAAAAIEQNNTGPSSESVASAEGSTTGADQGSGGPLQISCADQIERVKEHSVKAYNLSGANATFEQAFTDYQISLVMALDLESRAFSLDYRKLESWSWYGWDREYYETNPGPIRNNHKEYLGDGNLLENGWIQGDFTYSYISWSDEDDPETEEDSNQLIGFIDNAQETVTICLLPVGANRTPENENIDFDQAIAAGKDQLVPGWWNVNSCYVCSVE